MLDKATNQMLEDQCSYTLHKEHSEVDDSVVEVNEKLIKYLIENTTRNHDGRLVMPLLWNGRVAHLLGKNMRLAKSILKFNLKKLSKNKEYLQLMDDNVKEQIKLGFIEKVDNLEQFLQEHPQHSFLPHMGVFSLDHQSTKCRIVFLSNLCDPVGNGKMSVSHNQAIWPGLCINQKLSTSLLLLRFDHYLLCFDLKKAFLQIALNESDQNKLLFFWFRNIKKGDFTIEAYRNIRLSFGLRCSPTLLMVALFKILMLDTDNDDEYIKDLKKLIYSLIYMDNGAVTMNEHCSLKSAYNQLNSNFNPYKFELQQYVTNDKALQEEIDELVAGSTPDNVKLFGLKWDRVNDTLSTQKLMLDISANTKRLVLKTIAMNFDPYNFNGPVLNRARLFMHRLQIDKSLGWIQSCVLIRFVSGIT